MLLFFVPSQAQKPGGIKTRPQEASEREALARLRSEREREHIKLLCDLAGNKDLGDEVTDAAKQLVLEFLRRPRTHAPRPPPPGPPPLPTALALTPVRDRVDLVRQA